MLVDRDELAARSLTLGIGPQAALTCIDSRANDFRVLELIQPNRALSPATQTEKYFACFVRCDLIYKRNKAMCEKTTPRAEFYQEMSARRYPSIDEDALLRVIM
jgi:hypothetical protein